MSDFTPRANLRLPCGGSTGTILPDEQVDIDVLNDNFRKIDALLGARNIPSASSYAGSMDGDLIYARDTKLLSIYDANSAGLVNPRVAGGTRFKGTQVQMAAFTGAEDGDLFFNETDNTEYIRLGPDWKIFTRGMTSYTPVLSNGSIGTGGTLSGLYSVAGGWCSARAYARMGTSGFSWTDLNISLPLPARSDAYPPTVDNATTVAGSAVATDFSAGFAGRYTLGVIMAGTAASPTVRVGQLGTNGNMTFGTPGFTPAANDSVMVQAMYPVE